MLGPALQPRGLVLTLPTALKRFVYIVLIHAPFRMMQRSKCRGLCGNLLCVATLMGLPFFFSADTYGSQTIHGLAIQQVAVDGKVVAKNPEGRLNLGSYPQTIYFNFGANGANPRPPLRMRCKLDGFDSGWREGGGFMYLAVRFYNEAGDQIDQQSFEVSGESVGWSGSLKNSSFTHRRETLVVPPTASRVSVLISSAGPPATVGVYAVANLVVTESAGESQSTVLIPSPFDQLQRPASNPTEGPPGWIRDGTHLSMAKIVQIGRDVPIKALAIVDDDLTAHAEWRFPGVNDPAVKPGDHLVVEWNEMYSIGVGDFHSITYPSLPIGNYRFHVVGTDLMGNSDGSETVLAIIVPRPFWERPWFWGTVFVFIMTATIGMGRYLVGRRIRHQMQQLKNQQALERERLRIAHDIHDDLGARVTQITMMSAMSLNDPTLSEKTREELNQIKRMSRDLVSALYETVWAVNPEYDNLDALGSYLCQMAGQLCDRTEVHCRLHVSELPQEVQISSQIRHNITMAVKEAIHNVIKHARASEVGISMALNHDLLDITIQDNGCGFNTTSTNGGNGLTNMSQRMQNIGGRCSIESQPGTGTVVRLQMPVKRELPE